MEKENTTLKHTSFNKIDNKNQNIGNIHQSKGLIYGFSIIVSIQLLIFFYFFKFGNILLEYILNITNKDLSKDRLNISNNFQIEGKDFDEAVNQKYIFSQKFFCQNEFIFNNSLIEENLKVVNAKIKNVNFNMFVYKINSIVSNSISHNGFYEFRETNSILSALLYYTKKAKVEKHDVYVIDVGANIGWYTFTLGKEGYNVFSFEPSKINYYILLKNYCLNNDFNITIINKGLDNIEKNITLYHPSADISNGVAFDGYDLLNLTNPIKEKITLTKLSNYIQYLSFKHLAFIKLDIEGSEGKAIEGGLDLIVK